MVRRSRDAKFVIYQVLYIFVITVLALKGAEINLGEVVDKEKVVEKSVRDSLINIVDSLSHLGLKFNIEVDPDVIDENQMLKQKLAKLNTQVASLSKKVEFNPPKTLKYQEVSAVKPKNLPSPFSTKQKFLQFASNIAENKADYPIRIFDPTTKTIIVTIPPKTKTKFELSDQKTIKIQFGNQEEELKVNPNLPPEVKIEKVTTKMGKSDIYVRDLQRNTCFNVKIIDERNEQIKVSYTGPISVTGPRKDYKGNLVYTVSLKLANSEDRFNDWADRNDHLIDADDRYKVNFFFTAFDTKSKQKVEVGETFYFTEFSN